MVSLSIFRKKKYTQAVPPSAVSAKKAAHPRAGSAAVPEIAAAPPNSLPSLPRLPSLDGPVPPTPPSENPSYPSVVDEYADSAAVSSSESQEHHKLRPPALHTDLPIFSEPASPSSHRMASSAWRHPRASFVRHSRVLSGTSTIAGGLNSMFSPLQTLRHRQRKIITELPPELLPVVNLTNAQRLRQYVSGPIGVLAEDGLAWLTTDADLTGTELLIWIMGHSRPRYLNIQDCSVVPSRSPVPGDDSLYDLRILHDYNFNMAALRFGDSTDMHMWLAAMQLAKFEHTSLNEAFTAVILSLKGPQLSDIYTLLSHKKRFTRFEWCNVRLPQVSNKWIKVYMAIIPCDATKNGRIEIYASDKIAKKNLILYVNDVTSVYNVYPEDHRIIDFNLIMKLEGETFVSRLFEHLFSGLAAVPSSPKVRSRPSSIISFNSLNPPTPAQATGMRSRSTSFNSTSSFFTHAPSPNPEGPVSSSVSPTAKSQNFFKKQAVNNFVATNYLYLMPEPHPGVSAIEIMLRNLVHIIDAFKLYGRPEHLNSDKNDPISMLFGLPALPHFEYLSIEDAYGVVAANFATARLQDWGQNEWRSCLKEYLRCKQKVVGFKGAGDIYELFNSVDNASDVASIPDRTISPLPFMLQVQSHERGTMPLEIRDGLSYDEIPRVDDDGSSGSDIPDRPNGGGLGKSIDWDGKGRNEARTKVRTLLPIMDLPTPIDGAHGASYFTDEGHIPLPL